MQVSSSIINNKDKNKEKKSLIIPLYFTRDRSKKFNIEILPSHNMYEISQIYSADYFNYIPRDDPEKHFKFILIEKNNKYSEYILNDYFKPFKYLQTNNYDLFYFQLYIRGYLNVESNINQYYKIEENECLINYIQIFNRYKIKSDTIYKFSKRTNKFIKIIFTLHNDLIDIKKNKKIIYIPINSIISVDNYKEQDDYQPLRIRFQLDEKIKEYIIGISKKEFLIWNSIIHQQFEAIKKICTFNKNIEELRKINKNKKSLLVQLMNKNNTIEWNILQEKSKKIFLKEIKDENLQLLIEYISNYKISINLKNFIEAVDNLNKLVELLSLNQNFYEKYEDYEFLINENKRYKEIILKSNIDDNLIEIFRNDLIDKIYDYIYSKYLNKIIEDIENKGKDIDISVTNLSLFYNDSELINLNFSVPVSL